MKAWLKHLRDLTASTWRLRPHLRGGRYLIAAVVLSSFVAAVFEGVGVSMLIPLLSLLQDKEQMRPIRWLKEYLPNHSPGFYILVFCCLVIGAILAKNLVFYLSQMLSARLRYRILVNLRLSLYQRLHHADLHVFEQRTSGEITNVFATETARALGTVDVGINLLQRGSIAFCYVVALFGISWQLTLFALLLAVLMGLSLSSVYRRLARVGREITGLNEQLSTRISESFSGVRVVRATNSQKQVIEEFKQASETQAQAEQKIARTSLLLAPLAEVVAVTGAMFLIGFAYVFFVRPGFMLSSYLFGFGFCLLRLLPLVNQIYSMQGTFIHMSGGVKAVERWLESPQFPQRPFGHEPFKAVQQAIRFEKVGYAYANGTVALSDISFEVPAGKTIALVGGSGSGKSTIAALLLRFREPTAGRIVVDGRDYWEYSAASWHRHVGVVDQDAFLFHETMAGNIAYGFPEASRAEIDNAVRIAQLEDVVDQLPSGLDTIVGERGTMLSGGQRQRLAIARALVRGPQVLILDEATSALDNISEREVQAALEKAQQGRTVLVIAHRLSTIQRADQIVVLDKGRVMEQGTWGELVARKGVFAGLVEAAGDQPSTSAVGEKYL